MSKSLPLSLNRRDMLAGGAVALAAVGTSGCSSLLAQLPRSAAPPSPTAPAAADSVPLSAPPALPPSAVAPAPATQLPAYAAWKNPESLIVHTANTLETRRGAFGTAIITPAQQLYIRNNLPPPDASILVDRDAW